MKTFIIPKIKSKLPVAAVYKMSFDGDYFYIGGSANIKRRMWGWKHRLEIGAKKNILVSAAFAATSKVVFEIIEYVSDPAEVRKREDFYIKSYWGDKKLLNRVGNAFDSTGLKWTKEQIIKKPIFKTSCKKVAKFNQGGELLQIFGSRIEAALEIGVDPNRIRKCLKKYGHTVNGFVYKDVAEDGSFIDAPVVVGQKKGRAKGYKHTEATKQKLSVTHQVKVANGDYIQPEHSKAMIKFDMEGNQLATFPSIGAAAKSMNADTKNFKKLLKKGRQGYYKGFIWKYASQDAVSLIKY